MLIAAGDTRGRKTLFLGLLEENLERLAAGEPIVKRLDGKPHPAGIEDFQGPRVAGLEQWDVVILGPSDTRDLVERVRSGEVHVDEGNL